MTLHTCFFEFTFYEFVIFIDIKGIGQISSWSIYKMLLTSGICVCMWFYNTFICAFMWIIIIRENRINSGLLFETCGNVKRLHVQ